MSENFDINAMEIIIQRDMDARKDDSMPIYLPNPKVREQLLKATEVYRG